MHYCNNLIYKFVVGKLILKYVLTKNRYALSSSLYNHIPYFNVYILYISGLLKLHFNFVS